MNQLTRNALEDRANFLYWLADALNAKVKAEKRAPTLEERREINDYGEEAERLELRLKVGLV